MKPTLMVGWVLKLQMAIDGEGLPSIRVLNFGGIFLKYTKLPM